MEDKRMEINISELLNYEKLNSIDSDTKSKSQHKQVMEMLNNFYPEFYNIIIKEQFYPETLDDVNYFLLYNYYEVQKPSTMEFRYYKTDADEENGCPTVLRINSFNFYNAYSDKIWHKLSTKQKIQILYWHLENNKKTYNIKNVKFRIVQSNEVLEDELHDDSVAGQTICFEDDLEIYINLGWLDNYVSLIIAMEHEFEHVKQYQTNKFRLQKQGKNNIYEKCLIYGLKEYSSSSIIDDHAYYASFPLEMKAAKKSIKQMLKYMKINAKELGTTDNEQSLIQEEIDLYKEDWLEIPAEEKDKFGLTPAERKIYDLREKIKQDSPYFLKLMLLNEYYENLIDTTKNNTEKLKIYQKKNKVEFLIDMYNQTKQPEKLDKDFFKPLNLVDEEKQME